MFYLNNSETSWLVYADWLEDQDINATHIRELNPISNGWFHEYPCSGFVGSSLLKGIGGTGGEGVGGVSVGSTAIGFVGLDEDVGSGRSGSYVGCERKNYMD